MEEQLINFETAKLAKEKGFEEKCIHYYFSTWGKIKDKKTGIRHKIGQLNPNLIYFDKFSDGTIEARDGYRETYSKPSISIESIYYKNKDYKEESVYLAPTQSLLQKWLREVHNIIVFVAPLIPDCKEFGVTLYSNKYSCELDVAFYKTYEETLEVGLQEALKLIPNPI